MKNKFNLIETSLELNFISFNLLKWKATISNINCIFIYDIQDQYLVIQLWGGHIIYSVVISTYSDVIFIAVIYAYFINLNITAKCLDGKKLAGATQN